MSELELIIRELQHHLDYQEPLAYGEVTACILRLALVVKKMEEFSDGYAIHNAPRPLSRWRRFCCWMGWHKPNGKIGHDGCSATAQCYCGKRILQDSQGGWFARWPGKGENA